MKLKPLYKVSVERCIDGTSFDVEIAKLWGYRVAITPGRWLKNKPTAQWWVARQIEREMWKSLRRWKNSRPYIR
jgi:hypothetical protein